MEREIRKAKRKVEGFTDPENVAMAKAQLKEKQKQLREFIDKTNADEGAEVLRRDSGREKVYKDITADPVDNGGKSKRYASNYTLPEAKPDAPQATQENIEGNSSPEQNNAVQSSTETVTTPGNVNNKSVDKSEESGIIKETEETREFEPLPREKVVPILRKDSEKWINTLSSEEIRAIKKYTKNSGDPDDDKFFARLNAMLRGDIPEDETLKYYSDVISGAIAKFELKHDIVCYQNMKSNPFLSVAAGEVVFPGQFFSTSVSTKGTIAGPFKMEIFTPKGSSGAYIELLSKYPNQREFLFDKDNAYRVLSNNESKMVLEVIV